jgi:SRSO17 transposase
MTNWTAESEAAFDAYVEALIEVIGHADRAKPLKDYSLGLLIPMERKSVEPLAAVTAPRPRLGPIRCAVGWRERQTAERG